jgi:hypothetical protein
MILRSAFVACLLATPVPVAAPISFIQYPLVHKLSCAEGSGTAFRVGENHWLSVAHVTSLHDCEIDGAPVTVTEQDGTNDFSRLDTPLGVPNGFKVNCGGFVPGRWYWAVGHAQGAPFQTALAVYATFARYPDGKRILIGPNDFIPGMSGGPVMDDSGAVVGLVNAYIPGTPISLSRELRDTSMCGAGIA